MRLEGCRDDGCCRMEVYHDSQWGTICDDSFDGNDATVACRQLGCQAGTRVSNFGGGTGQIWMNYHSCDGTETKLEDCSSAAWGNSYGCDHSEDVGVCCTSCPSQPSSSSDFIMTRKLMTPDIWYTGTPAAVAQFCGHIYEHALNNKTAFYERIDDSVVKRDYYANDKELLTPRLHSGDDGLCTLLGASMNRTSSLSAKEKVQVLEYFASRRDINGQTLGVADTRLQEFAAAKQRRMDAVGFSLGCKSGVRVIALLLNIFASFV